MPHTCTPHISIRMYTHLYAFIRMSAHMPVAHGFAQDPPLTELQTGPTTHRAADCAFSDVVSAWQVPIIYAFFPAFLSTYTHVYTHVHTCMVTRISTRTRMSTHISTHVHVHTQIPAVETLWRGNQLRSTIVARTTITIGALTATTKIAPCQRGSQTLVVRVFPLLEIQTVPCGDLADDDKP